MTEEEKRMRDNIALVAMQCLIKNEMKTSLFDRIFNRRKSEEFYDDPTSVAEEAYEYAQCMMNERRKINRNEEEV